MGGLRNDQKVTARCMLAGEEWMHVHTHAHTNTHTHTVPAFLESGIGEYPRGAPTEPNIEAEWLLSEQRQ